MRKSDYSKLVSALGILTMSIALLWTVSATPPPKEFTVPTVEECFIPECLLLEECIPAPPPTEESAPPAPLPYTGSDIELLAKTVWGEARICQPDEQALVVWTVLQRVDADGWADTIEGVVTAPHQFQGYREGNPVDEDIYALCAAELGKWAVGEAAPTHEVYAPTVPYFFFEGSGRHNWFRAEWR